MKANISVYGLCEPPHAWYVSLKSILEKEGANKANLTILCFTYVTTTCFMLHVSVICSHIYDSCWGGTKLFQLKIIDIRKQSFHVSQEVLQI